MSNLLQNMAGMIGNIRFMRLVNTAVKQHYQTSRPFITIVVEQDGNASVHSNMDNAEQRVKLMEECAASLKNPTSQNIVQLKN